MVAMVEGVVKYHNTLIVLMQEALALSEVVNHG